MVNGSHSQQTTPVVQSIGKRPVLIKCSVLHNVYGQFFKIAAQFVYGPVSRFMNAWWHLESLTEMSYSQDTLDQLRSFHLKTCLFSILICLLALLHFTMTS